MACKKTEDPLLVGWLFYARGAVVFDIAVIRQNVHFVLYSF